MRCFACNAEVPLRTGQRVGFRDSCDRCDADLHACRNCSFHDSSAYNECRESSAERVGDRERANRCDYFSPGDAGGGSVEAARQDSLSDLDKLFKH